MLLAGYLIDVVGVRIILVGGSLITAAAVGTLGLRRTYGRAFGSLLLAGLGGAGLSTAAILLMPHAFFGTDRLASASIRPRLRLHGARRPGDAGAVRRAGPPDGVSPHGRRAGAAVPGARRCWRSCGDSSRNCRGRPSISANC